MLHAAYDSIAHVNSPVHTAQESELFSLLTGVHSSDSCVSRPCVIHNPTDHHMRSWTLHWRNDRGIFERLCPKHSCGHPDPDQFDYWAEVDQSWQAVHGCCSCCHIAQPDLSKE